MPLQLLPYDSIIGSNSKDTYTFHKKEYDKFGTKIIAILNNKSLEKNIPECTFMANIRVMKILLGSDFSIETLHSGREFPRKILQSKVKRKRRTCVIEGVSRFLIINEKRLQK